MHRRNMNRYNVNGHHRHRCNVNGHNVNGDIWAVVEVNAGGLKGRGHESVVFSKVGVNAEQPPPPTAGGRAGERLRSAETTPDIGCQGQQSQKESPTLTAALPNKQTPRSHATQTRPPQLHHPASILG